MTHLMRNSSQNHSSSTTEISSATPYVLPKRKQHDACAHQARRGRNDCKFGIGVHVGDAGEVTNTIPAATVSSPWPV